MYILNKNYLTIILNLNKEIYSISDNIDDFLDYKKSDLLNKHISNFIPKYIYDKIEFPKQEPNIPFLPYFQLITIKNQNEEISEFMGSIIKTNQYYIIELEKINSNIDMERKINPFFNKLSKINKVNEACDLVISQINEILNFEKIFLVKINDDHGYVLIDKSNVEYNNSDKFKNLYLNSEFLNILNINKLSNVLINYNNNNINDYHIFNTNGLNINSDFLISTKNIQLQETLLQHGYKTTLILSIIVNEKIWGLMFCCFSNEKHINIENRLACGQIIDLLGTQISKIESIKRFHLNNEIEKLNNEIYNDIDYKISLNDSISKHSLKILKFFECKEYYLKNNDITTYSSEELNEKIKNIQHKISSVDKIKLIENLDYDDELGGGIIIKFDDSKFLFMSKPRKKIDFLYEETESYEKEIKDLYYYSAQHKKKIMYNCDIFDKHMFECLDKFRMCILEYISHEEKIKSDEKLNYKAMYDQLTLLPNRTMFKKILEELLEQENLIALLFIDLDNFKSVNDTLGHQIGDGLLKYVANKLKSVVRKNDIVFRLSGDEFTIILPNVQNKIESDLIAEKIINIFKEPVYIEGRPCNVSASIGIAFSPYDGDQYDKLIKCADYAMYKSKKEGKNKFTRFNNIMGQEIEENYIIKEYIKKAIEDTSIINIHYQPIVDMNENKIYGAEGLVRIKTEKQGFLTPDKFMKIADENHLMIELEEKILLTAVNEFKDFLNNNDLILSLNLSGHLFKSNAIISILEEIEKTNIDMTKINFEITESVMIHKTEMVLSIFNKIISYGCSISLDDFGTGYSSLAYLVDLPIHNIKIDKSFITNLTNEKATILIKAVVALGKELQKTVIAEGIEGKSHQNLLTKLGVNLLQGYYYLEPEPYEKFIKYYNSKNNK